MLVLSAGPASTDTLQPLAAGVDDEPPPEPRGPDAPPVINRYDPSVEQWRQQIWQGMPDSLKSRPDAATLLDKTLHAVQGESSGDPGATGDGGIAHGLFQSHYVGAGATPQAQIADAWRLVEGDIRQGGTGFGDWGEGRSYQGQPFGAFGRTPYGAGDPLAQHLSTGQTSSFIPGPSIAPQPFSPYVPQPDPFATTGAEQQMQYDQPQQDATPYQPYVGSDLQQHLSTGGPRLLDVTNPSDYQTMQEQVEGATAPPQEGYTYDPNVMQSRANSVLGPSDNPLGTVLGPVQSLYNRVNPDLPVVGPAIRNYVRPAIGAIADIGVNGAGGVVSQASQALGGPALPTGESLIRGGIRRATGAIGSQLATDVQQATGLGPRGVNLPSASSVASAPLTGGALDTALLALPEIDRLLSSIGQTRVAARLAESGLGQMDVGQAIAGRYYRPSAEEFLPGRQAFIEGQRAGPGTPKLPEGVPPEPPPGPAPGPTDVGRPARPGMQFQPVGGGAPTPAEEAAQGAGRALPAGTTPGPEAANRGGLAALPAPRTQLQANLDALVEAKRAGGRELQISAPEFADLYKASLGPKSKAEYPGDTKLSFDDWRYATQQGLAAGGTWYREIAQFLNDASGSRLPEILTSFAVGSQKAEPADNLVKAFNAMRAANDLTQGGTQPLDLAALTQAIGKGSGRYPLFPDQVKKIYDAYTTGRAITASGGAAKTPSYARNIADAFAGQFSPFVTGDTHHMGYPGIGQEPIKGKYDIRASAKAPSNEAFDFVDRLTQHLASEFGLSYDVVQAAMWDSIKKVKEHTPTANAFNAGDITFKEAVDRTRGNVSSGSFQEAFKEPAVQDAVRQFNESLRRYPPRGTRNLEFAFEPKPSGTPSGTYAVNQQIGEQMRTDVTQRSPVVLPPRGTDLVALGLDPQTGRFPELEDARIPHDIEGNAVRLPGGNIDTADYVGALLSKRSGTESGWVVELPNSRVTGTPSLELDHPAGTPWTGAEIAKLREGPGAEHLVFTPRSDDPGVLQIYDVSRVVPDWKLTAERAVREAGYKPQTLRAGKLDATFRSGAETDGTLTRLSPTFDARGNIASRTDAITGRGAGNAPGRPGARGNAPGAGQGAGAQGISGNVGQQQQAQAGGGSGQQGGYVPSSAATGGSQPPPQQPQPPLSGGPGAAGGGAAGGGAQPPPAAPAPPRIPSPPEVEQANQTLDSARKALLQSVVDEARLRRQGVPQEEIAQGRSRQAQGIHQGVLSGIEAGLSPEEIAAQGAVGARTGQLRKTFAGAPQVSPDQRAALIDEANRQLFTGQIQEFDWLRTVGTKNNPGALTKALEGRGLQPNEIEMLRKVYGDAVAEAVMPQGLTLQEALEASRGQRFEPPASNPNAPELNLGLQGAQAGALGPQAQGPLGMPATPEGAIPAGSLNTPEARTALLRERAKRPAGFPGTGEASDVTSGLFPGPLLESGAQAGPGLNAVPAAGPTLGQRRLNRGLSEPAGFPGPGEALGPPGGKPPVVGGAQEGFGGNLGPQLEGAKPPKGETPLGRAYRELLSLINAPITIVTYGHEPVFRQGLGFAMSHRSVAKQALADMVTVAKNPEAAALINARLNSDPYVRAAIDAGWLTENDRPAETVVNKVLNKFPGMRNSRESARMYLTSLRKMGYADEAAALFRSGNWTDEDAKALWDTVGDVTGHGLRGKSLTVGGMSPSFSPDAMFGRFRGLSDPFIPEFGNPKAGGSPLGRGARNVALKNLLALGGLALTIEGLAYASGDDLKWDLLNTPLGKVTLGPSTLDPSAGYGTIIRLAAKTADAVQSGDFGRMRDALSSFVNGQLGPVTGTMLAALSGQDWQGKDFNLVKAITENPTKQGSLARQLFVPIAANAIWDAAQASGLKGALFALPSLGAMSVDTNLLQDARDKATRRLSGGKVTSYADAQNQPLLKQQVDKDASVIEAKGSPSQYQEASDTQHAPTKAMVDQQEALFNKGMNAQKLRDTYHDATEQNISSARALSSQFAEQFASIPQTKQQDLLQKYYDLGDPNKNPSVTIGAGQVGEGDTDFDKVASVRKDFVDSLPKDQQDFINQSLQATELNKTPLHQEYDKYIDAKKQAGYFVTHIDPVTKRPTGITPQERQALDIAHPDLDVASWRFGSVGGKAGSALNSTKAVQMALGTPDAQNKEITYAGLPRPINQSPDTIAMWKYAEDPLDWYLTQLPNGSDAVNEGKRLAANKQDKEYLKPLDQMDTQHRSTITTNLHNAALKSNLGDELEAYLYAFGERTSLTTQAAADKAAEIIKKYKLDQVKAPMKKAA